MKCRLQTYFVMRFSCNLLPGIGLQIVSMYLLKRDQHLLRVFSALIKMDLACVQNKTVIRIDGVYTTLVYL